MTTDDIKRYLLEEWFKVINYPEKFNAISCHPEHWDALIMGEAFDHWWDADRLLKMRSKEIPDNHALRFMGKRVVLNQSVSYPTVSCVIDGKNESG